MLSVEIQEKVPEKIRIIFFGYSHFSRCVLETICARGYIPTAIVTRKNSPVAESAKARNIQFFTPTTLADAEFIDTLTALSGDIFFVAAFTKLPKSVFEIPQHGMLNLHPSLLPKYRGGRPEQAQILCDEKNIGITIHLIDEKFDHGPIIAQQKTAIYPWPPTASTMGFELAVQGGQLFADILPDWMNKKIVPVPQNEEEVTNVKDIIHLDSNHLSHSMSAYEQFKYFRALGQSVGVFYDFVDAHNISYKVNVKNAYYRNETFVIVDVTINDDEEWIPYEQFLEQYNLIQNQEWAQYSAQYNSAVCSGIDTKNDNTYIRLREAIFERVIVRSSEPQFVTPRGIEQPGWLFDFRKIIMQSDYMNLIAEIFWEKYKNVYPFQIGGQEVAAIPILCALALKGDQLGMPINAFFIRKTRKKTGLQNFIEGHVTKDKIILVDDLMNFGTTQLRLIEMLEKDGHTIHNIFVITQFRDKNYYILILQKGVTITSLFTPQDFGLRLSKVVPPPFDKSGFQILWKFESMNPNHFHIVPKSAPLLDANKVYFGSDNGTFWALNQNDGGVAWKFKIWKKSAGKAIFSSPALHDNTVYFGAYDGNVYALDTETGEKKWDFWEADWVGSSPALAPDLDTLYIGLEFGLFKKRGGIVALDMKTGKKKWEYSMPELTHASPAYSKKFNAVGIGCNDGIFRMFNARTGVLQWQVETKGDIKYSAVFDEKRRYVLFGSFDGNIYICDVTTGTLVHTFTTEGPVYSTPSIHNDSAYITSQDKRLYCVALDTFQEKWQFETTGRIFCDPVIVNESVFVGSNDGFLHELSLEGSRIDFFIASERIVNKIAYNPRTKMYFVPTHANEIYCIKKAGTSLST